MDETRGAMLRPVSIDDLDDRRASELADLGAMSVERKP